MPPRVKIGESCWARAQRELDRVYPCEGIGLPLVALVPTRPARNPCAAMGLDDLAELVISRIVLVPGERQVNLPARVGVTPLTDPLVNAAVGAELRRFPRLRACAYLHSHPFARGRTLPSRGPGCDVEGHMLPLLARNRDCGLHASFSFIACREAGGRGWRLQAFALDGQARLVDLGFAAPVPDAALGPLMLGPLSRRPPHTHLLRRFRRELRRRGYRSRTDDLFDGWRRTIVRVNPDLQLVILLPLDFPHGTARCFVVRRPGRTRELPPPPFSLGAWIHVIQQVAETPPARELPDHATS